MFTKRSKGEIEVFDHLSYDNKWMPSDRKLINPYELDMINHTTKTAVEYCGIYWHGENSSGKARNYHKNKYDLCKEKGYKLYTIFENEWKSPVKQKIIKSLLNNYPQKIYARKTYIKEIVDINERRDFFKATHIQGDLNCNCSYGLYDDTTDELLMCISYLKPRSNKNFDFEVGRMSTKLDVCVIGGASKLFKNSSKIYGKNIITYSDLRYGEGKVYEKLGFKYSHTSKPNYFYFKPSEGVLYSRNKFQKHKLGKLLDIFDGGISEWENMKINGYDRIWDCGNNVYVRDDINES